MWATREAISGIWVYPILLKQAHDSIPMAPRAEFQKCDCIKCTYNEPSQRFTAEALSQRRVNASYCVTRKKPTDLIVPFPLFSLYNFQNGRGRGTLNASSLLNLYNLDIQQCSHHSSELLGWCCTIFSPFQWEFDFSQRNQRQESRRGVLRSLDGFNISRLCAQLLF